MNTFTRVAIATFAMVGIAGAQPKTDAKAPVKADVKTDVKADAKMKVEPKTPVVAGDKKAAPEMPKPAVELADMAKLVVGTWRCKGQEFGMDGAAAAVTAVNKSKLDMDKFWLVDNLEVKGKTTFKMQSFTTYDSASKKWRRVAVDNFGGYMVGTSDGMKDNKVTFNLDTMGPMGAGMFRDHADMTDMKAGAKFWGEMSMDKGKTWAKAYEMTCKK